MVIGDRSFNYTSDVESKFTVKNVVTRSFVVSREMRASSRTTDAQPSATPTAAKGEENTENGERREATTMRMLLRRQQPQHELIVRRRLAG